MAEGSANCAAINLIFYFFRQHVISGSTASRKGAGEGHYARNCINIPRPMVLNLAMLNDYRTCTCTFYTMHRHTAPVVFILVLLYLAGRPYEKIPFSPLYTDTVHFMEGTKLYPTPGTLSAEDPPPNPPGSPLSKYDQQLR